jgi:hypothetical protein
MDLPRLPSHQYTLNYSCALDTSNPRSQRSVDQLQAFVEGIGLPLGKTPMGHGNLTSYYFTIPAANAQQTHDGLVDAGYAVRYEAVGDGCYYGLLDAPEPR